MCSPIPDSLCHLTTVSVISTLIAHRGFRSWIYRWNYRSRWTSRRRDCRSRLRRCTWHTLTCITTRHHWAWCWCRFRCWHATWHRFRCCTWCWHRRRCYSTHWLIHITYARHIRSRCRGWCRTYRILLIIIVHLITSFQAVSVCCGKCFSILWNRIRSPLNNRSISPVGPFLCLAISSLVGICPEVISLSGR